MEAFEISEDSMEAFLPLLGEDASEDMKRMFYRGIGVRDGGEEAVGVFVLELLDCDGDEETKGRITLSNYRDREAFEALIRFYTEQIVRREEIGESFYELQDEGKAEDLRSAGFSGEKKESEEVRVTLGEISRLEIAKKKKLPEHIGSIEAISPSQYRRAIKKILFKGQKGILEDLAFLPKNWFEERISACSVSDGNVDGLFLVRKNPSGSLMPALLYAFGPEFKKTLVSMLSYAAKKAVELYGPETAVVINRKNPPTRALVSKLLPTAKGASVIWGSRKETALTTGRG